VQSQAVLEKIPIKVSGQVVAVKRKKSKQRGRGSRKRNSLMLEKRTTATFGRQDPSHIGRNKGFSNIVEQSKEETQKTT